MLTSTFSTIRAAKITTQRSSSSWPSSKASSNGPLSFNSLWPLKLAFASPISSILKSTLPIWHLTTTYPFLNSRQNPDIGMVPGGVLLYRVAAVLLSIRLFLAMGQDFSWPLPFSSTPWHIPWKIPLLLSPRILRKLPWIYLLKASSDLVKDFMMKTRMMTMMKWGATEEGRTKRSPKRPEKILILSAIAKRTAPTSTTTEMAIMNLIMPTLM